MLSYTSGFLRYEVFLCTEEEHACCRHDASFQVCSRLSFILENMIRFSDDCDQTCRLAKALLSLYNIYFT